MSVNVVMPPMGESVSSGMIASWLKKPGDLVAKDEAIVSINTDKADVDVPSPVAGRLGVIRFQQGAEVKVGEVLAEIEPSDATAAAAPAKPAEAPKPVEAPKPAEVKAAPAAPALSPAVAYHVEKNGLDAGQISGTGPGGRILKGDVLDALAKQPAPAPAPVAPPVVIPAVPQGDRSETVETMTPIRRTIARRLIEAQTNAAILTTFNEVDMSRIMALREEFQDAFTKKHGIKLGFMSFFVKACVEALKLFPLVNAEIRGDQIVKKNYYDIGVAVGGGKGLVVPIMRNAEKLSFATIEKTIADFGARAKDSKIKLEEMQGGTFSITNGGIYGSMLSTPILNPPQSAILGMHNIQKRAVVVNDQVVVRPMMYLALSYDHRLVDGREAVTFLVRVKESLEKPERLLLEI